MIIGLTRGVTNAHISRAVLQSIAFSIKDITDAIYDYTKTKVKDIRIDGGASKNNLLAQMFADYLDCRIVRPSSVEATSLGTCRHAYRILEGRRSRKSDGIRCRIQQPDGRRSKREILLQLQRCSKTLFRLDGR